MLWPHSYTKLAERDLARQDADQKLAIKVRQDTITMVKEIKVAENKK